MLNFATAKTCVICLEDFKDPFITKCNHMFCKECILKAIEASPYCPVCKVALRKIVGNQPPNGTMTYQVYNNYYLYTIFLVLICYYFISVCEKVTSWL